MAHKRRKIERRGRPKRADARRRKTTVAERSAPDDLGTPQLRTRKLHVANGGGEAVELIDTIGVLAAHNLLDTELTLIARLLASWLRQVQRAFHLSLASPAGLWSAITSGAGIGQWTVDINAPGCDRALFRLAQLYEHFAELGQIDQLAFVMRIVEGTARPTNHRDLLDLQSGLRAVAELHRRGRGHRPPVEVPASA